MTAAGDERVPSRTTKLHRVAARVRSLTGVIGAITAYLVIGSCDGPTEPQPTPDQTLTVELSGYGRGTVTSQPAAIDCNAAGGTCTLVAPRGSSVTLSATSEDGHVFAGWNKACSGTGACVVRLDGDRTVEAAFDNPQLAVVQIGPAGGTITSVDSRVTIVVPAGALVTSVPIRIEPLPKIQLGPEFAGINVTRAYRLEPAGTVFQQPATVTVASDQKPTVNGDSFSFQLEGLLLSHAGSVEPLSQSELTLTPNGVSLSGTLKHFSDLVEVVPPDFGDHDGPSYSGTVGRIVGVPDELFIHQTFDANIEIEILHHPVDDPLGVFYVDDSRLPLKASGTSTPMSSSGQVPLAFPFVGVMSTYETNVRYGCTSLGEGLLSSWIRIDYLTPERTNLALTLLPVIEQIKLEFPVKAVKCIADVPRRQLTVEVIGQGDVTSEPPGINCPAGSCRETYDDGTSVELFARERENAVFLGWGDGCGEIVIDEPGVDRRRAVIPMDQDRHCTATFSSGFHVLMLELPTEGIPDDVGITSSPEGINVGNGANKNEASFAAGTEVKLIPTVQSGSGAQVEFEGDGVTDQDGNRVVTMDEEKRIKANFLYNLAVRVENSGGSDGLVTDKIGKTAINCSEGGGVCDATVPWATYITLVARPAEHFVKWGGDCLGDSIAVVPIERTSLCIAYFHKPGADDPTLTVVPDGGPPSDGLISSFPFGILCGLGEELCSAPFAHGTDVTLLFTPEENSGASAEFSGDGAQHDGTWKVTVSQNSRVDVKFFYELFVTVNNAPDADGSVTDVPGGQKIACTGAGGDGCRASFERGTEVTLQASPDEQFVAWSGDASGSVAATKVVMDRLRSVTADFAPTLEQLLEISLTTPPGTSARVTSDEEGTNGERIDCPGICWVPANLGDVFTLRVADVSAGYSFQFSGAGEMQEDGSRRVEVDGKTVVGVTIVPAYELVVTTDGDGSGLVYSAFIHCPHPGGGPGCTYEYPEGTRVMLLADPASDSEFGGWSHGCEATLAPDVTHLEMDQPRGCKATFHRKSGLDPNFLRIGVRVRADIKALIRNPIAGTGTRVMTVGRDETARAVGVDINVAANTAKTTVLPFNVSLAESDFGVTGVAFNPTTERAYVAGRSGVFECATGFVDCVRLLLPQASTTDRMHRIATSGPHLAVTGQRNGQPILCTRSFVSELFCQLIPGMQLSQTPIPVAIDGAGNVHVAGRSNENSDWLVKTFSPLDETWSGFSTSFFQPVDMDLDGTGVLYTTIWSGGALHVAHRLPDGTVGFSPGLSNMPPSNVCLAPEGNSLIIGATIGSASNVTTVATIGSDGNLRRDSYPGTAIPGCVIGGTPGGAPLVIFTADLGDGQLQVVTVAVNQDKTPGAATSTTVQVPSVLGPAGSDVKAGDEKNPVFAAGAFGVVARSDGSDLLGSVEARSTNGDALTLRAVWAASANEAWAAGDGGTILRFSGGTWSRVANPAETNNATLYGLSGSTADDVYAVGDNGTIMRWNGASWTHVSAGQTSNTFLLSVWNGGAGNVYVGGAATGGSSVLYHFNGSSWSQVPLPGGSSMMGGIVSVWGSGPSDVWAMTASRGLLRWNGTVWSLDTQTLTQLPGGPRVPYAIRGSGPNDVFAVLGGVPGMQTSVVLRHDGSSWRVIHQDLDNLLVGLSVHSSGTVHVFGSNGTVLRGIR